MAVNKSIIAFNAGEYSPLLEGRIDMDKYSMSCRTLENFRPTKYGAATKRPGTEFISEVKDSTDEGRLFKFQFSTAISYILEGGDQYFRFYEDGTQIPVPTSSAWATSTVYSVGDIAGELGIVYYCLVAHTSGTFATDLASGYWVALGVSGDPYEITSPWSDSELFDIHYAQINDVIYFVHPDHAPYKLSRFADYYWTLEEVIWDWPALLDENITDVTIAPSAKTGSAITLAASGDLFKSEHVGGYWYIEHKTVGTSAQVNMSAAAGTVYSSSLRVKGDWQITTSERWWGTLTLQRSDSGTFGADTEEIREFKSTSERNVSVEGTEEKKTYLRLKYTAAGDPYASPPFNIDNTGGGTPTAVDYTFFEAQGTLEIAEQFLGGFVKITGYNSPTSVTAQVIEELESTAATKLWAEGAWSPFRGFPRAIALYEQRLTFGGTDYQRQTIWLSQSNDYENLEYGPDDADAMQYTIGSQEFNEILWLVSQTRLIIGTSGGEFSIGANDPTQPLTPTNVFVRQQSNFGSDSLQAKLVNDVVLFVQRQGRKVRELTYSFEKDGFVAPDMTILSEHITQGGIKQIDYQNQPDAIFWAIRNDGELLGMTYERQENVVGWFRFVTQGLFESVALIYGDDADEVWTIVNRTISGVTKRYVERFVVQDFETDQEDRIHLDSSLSFDGGSAVNLSNLTNARPPVATSSGHPFINDQQVIITETGIPEVDGIELTVKNKTSSTWELYNEAGTEPWDLRVQEEYEITTVSNTTPNVTVNTVTTHHFVAGDVVEINGVTGSAGILLNGKSFTVVSVTTYTVVISLFPSLGTWVANGGNIKLFKGASAYATGGKAQRVENTFTNLDHLEGKTIKAIVDGATTPDKVVQSGSVSLDDYGNVVHIGLGYTGKLKPQKLALALQTGSSIGKTLAISEMTLRLYQTLGLKGGETEEKAQNLKFRGTDDDMDGPPPLFTGDYKMQSFPGGNNKSGDIIILSEDPLPATILGLFPKVGAFG